MAEKVESRLPSVMQKTTFSVSGLCCASEAALVHKLLEPLQGIENVSVNTVAKTVIVLHDSTQVPASHIVDALNKAKLNASIRELGKVKERRKPWPSWNIIACGLLLIIAMFSYIYQPLIWIALASIAVGILGMLRRSWSAIRRFVLDINVLMVIAAFGAIGLGDFIEGASIVFLFTFAEWLEEMSGVVLIAGVIAIVPLVLRLHEIHQWLYLSLVLVVVACPCALVISTPVAKVCGLSAAAKMGRRRIQGCGIAECVPTGGYLSAVILRRDSLVTVQSLSSACINLALKNRACVQRLVKSHAICALMCFSIIHHLSLPSSTSARLVAA